MAWQMKDTQLVQLAKTAGFKGDEVPIAVAIAIAESGSDAHAMNSKSTATGLWQIMYSVWVRDADAKKAGLKSRNDLKNPVLNADIAHIVYRKQGWAAWSVYTSGTYAKYLDRARKATAEKDGDYVPPNTVGEAVGIPIEAGWEGLGDNLQKVTATGGVILIGVVFLMLGVAIFIGVKLNPVRKIQKLVG